MPSIISRCNSLKIDGVIFDLDGTLTKYSVDRKALTFRIFSYLKSNFLFFKIYSCSDFPITIIRKTEILLKAMKLCKPLIEKTISDLYNLVDVFELKASENTILFNGVYESLELVKSLGLKCGLFTLCGRRSTENVLLKFNLKSYFDAVVTRDDVKNFKPHPEHLLKVISLLGLHPRRVLVVGDSTLDVISAKKIKATPIAVKTGVRTIEELKKAGAKIILNSIADFPTLLKALF